MPDTADPEELAAAALADHGVVCTEPRAPLAAVVALVRAATDGGMPDAARERLQRFLAVRIRGS